MMAINVGQWGQLLSMHTWAQSPFLQWLFPLDCGEAYQLTDDTNRHNSESDPSLENQVYTRLNI